MDWTVNDGLYYMFLKWKLKCENILDCELAMLPESKKCKKVIAWSGDFGMDQYVSSCCPWMASDWILLDPSMKSFASPKQMRPDEVLSDHESLAMTTMFMFCKGEKAKVLINNGSVLLSCATILALGLKQPHTRLDYLLHRASLSTSSADHPKMTKSLVNVHVSRKESTVSNLQGIVPKFITSKEQILQAYPDGFDGIGCFHGPPYHTQIDSSVTTSQTPC